MCKQFDGILGWMFIAAADIAACLQFACIYLFNYCYYYCCWNTFLSGAVPVFVFFILHFFFFFHSLCTISKPSANLFAYNFNSSHSFPTAGKILNERDWKDCDLFSTFRTIYMNHFIGGNKSGRVNNNNKFIRNEICTFTGISWRKISCSQ